MAKGAKARYRIPEFNPFAGPSPNCWAVLVQMEHWAEESLANSEKRVMNNKISPHFFILQR